MLKQPHKRDTTTPRVVYLCPLDSGGLIGAVYHIWKHDTVFDQEKFLTH